MIFLLILALFCPAVVHAEWYVAGDVLQSHYARPNVDGTWKQDLIPNGSGFDGTSLAYDAGFGYRFAGDERAWTQLWSVEMGYRHWGDVTASGNWVTDEQYEQVTEHGAQWIVEHDIHAPHMSATNRLHGGYLRVMKGVDVGYGFEPYVSVGGFGAGHITIIDGTKRPFSGEMAGPTVGGGIKYTILYGVKARVGVDSHWSITERNYPISSHWLTVGGGIEVPVTGWW